MKTEKRELLTIGCSYKNLKHAEILIEDKVFISSIAALKYDECPKNISILLRALSDELVKELEKNK